jgi:hypothetical protein
MVGVAALLAWKPGRNDRGVAGPRGGPVGPTAARAAAYGSPSAGSRRDNAANQHQPGRLRQPPPAVTGIDLYVKR